MSKIWIGVISLFPQMFSALDVGMSGRAQHMGQLTLAHMNPRDYTSDKHRTVDDRPYGGGPGMVMLAEPLAKAIEAAKKAAPAPAKVMYMSPQGVPLTQARVNALAKEETLILLAGRYEGIDERLINSLIDEECSIGDYVLSGGELPAMVLIDAIARLLPGVLGDALSAEQDSFMDGLLDCPHYTRPDVYAGQAVPSVLLSGNHADIAAWRRREALLRTFLRRPELLAKASLTADDCAYLEALRTQDFLNEEI